MLLLGYVDLERRPVIDALVRAPTNMGASPAVDGRACNIQRVHDAGMKWILVQDRLDAEIRYAGDCMNTGTPTQSPIPRLAALRYRDFRLFWVGGLIASIGAQMLMIGVNWHVYRLLQGDAWTIAVDGRDIAINGQALGLGALGFVRVLPIMVFSLLGGVLADSLDRRRLIIGAHGVAALFATLLAVCTLSHHVNLAVIFALTAASGAASALYGPATDALAPQLVEKQHLTNAISLTSLEWAVGSIAGPALAGIAITALSLGSVYLCSAASSVAMILAVGMVRHRGPAGGSGVRVSVQSLLEGVRFTRGTSIIWGTMLLDFWATFFSSARTMLPIVADKMLGVGVQGYGLLSTAQPTGALVAALAMALRRDIRRQGTLLLGGVALYGAATALFGLSSSFALSYALFALTGVGDMVSTVIRGNIRQMRTPNELRGRLNSVHLMLALGGPQLGELEAGVVAAVLGVSVTLVSGGILTVVLAGWVAWKYRDLRDVDRA